MNLVITQPMFFPWSGMMEQLQLADTLVIYDDVNFSKGSFTNRVQIKTMAGIQWLTIPVKQQKNVLIRDLEYAENINWKKKHIESFKQAYAKSEHVHEATELLESVYSQNDTFCKVVVESMKQVMEYLGISPEILSSSDLGVGGSGSQRVLDICEALKATRYITGHGAKNYLDHESFERAGVEVDYMKYSLPQTKQLHDDFTPYVSILDLIANHGKETAGYLNANTVPWRKEIT